jgi:hypothetical protein
MTFVRAIDTGKFTYFDFSEMTAAGVALTPTAGLPAPPIGSSQDYSDWWKKLQEQRFAGQ